MKKFTALLLFLALFLTGTAAMAATVPASSSDLPDMLRCPDTPQIIRVQQQGGSIILTLDRALPREHLVTALAIDGSGCKADVNAASPDSMVYTASGLPSGGQWVGFEVAWVDGGVNAVALYNAYGGLEHVTRFDGRYNEYLFDNDGTFYEFAYADGGVRARFNTRGVLTSYGYQAIRNTTVWFDLQGNILFAHYDDGTLAATFEPGLGWYIPTASGRISIDLNVSVWGASPLLPPEEEEEEEPEVVWYPRNTITLAGLTLQEAHSSLPDKWYNVIPINLTVQGRQTYFLVISHARFIGECYVDVYGDEVTVSCSLMENSSIEPLESYGRWFTRLGDITADSIEAYEDAITFGQPMSISRDLDGAQVALLFIRSKATYRLPFRDGTEMTRYWRNKPDWKQFRENLMPLMPYVNP